MTVLNIAIRPELKGDQSGVLAESARVIISQLSACLKNCQSLDPLSTLQVSLAMMVAARAILDEWNSIGRGEPELRPLHPSARSLLLWSLSTCRALIVPLSAAARSLLLWSLSTCRVHMEY